MPAHVRYMMVCNGLARRSDDLVRDVGAYFSVQLMTNCAVVTSIYAVVKVNFKVSFKCVEYLYEFAKKQSFT